MRDNRRTTVVSAVLGLALLVGMVAFAVGLPELDSGPSAGSDAESASAGSGAASNDEPVELPDELSLGLRAVDLGTLPAELTQQFGDLDALTEQEDAVAAGLDEVFGAPGDFRIYASEEGPALANVAVLGRDPGLFLEALPLDSDLLEVERPSAELTRVGDAVCSINWGQAVPAGQPVDAAAPPQSVRCQLGADGRTIEITAQGLDVESTVSVAEDLAAQL
jgi:hypothetical protein